MSSYTTQPCMSNPRKPVTPSPCIRTTLFTNIPTTDTLMSSFTWMTQATKTEKSGKQTDRRSKRPAGRRDGFRLPGPTSRRYDVPHQFSRVSHSRRKDAHPLIGTAPPLPLRWRISLLLPPSFCRNIGSQNHPGRVKFFLHRNGHGPPLPDMADHAGQPIRCPNPTGFK